VLECKTLAEAAEHLEMLVTDDAMFIEGPDEGQDEPEEYSPNAPPSYGIKFNLRAAWEVMEAMKGRARVAEATK